MSTWWAKYDTIDPKEGRDGGQKTQQEYKKTKYHKKYIYIYI